MDRTRSSPPADRQTDATAEDALVWGLCIATLNRADVLHECVSAALKQTRPPAEVVIVDASADIGPGKARIETLCKTADVPLVYVAAPRPSLATQRNVAIGHATADILFLIDDDAFLHRDCAERVMAIYEDDPEARIAAVGPTEAARTAVAPRTDPQPERKTSAAARSRIDRLRGGIPLGRWIEREILLMSPDYFVPPYEPRATDSQANGVPHTLRVRSMSGFRMTVRREIALRERFDDHLLAYCPGEDLDATTRFGRHGLVLLSEKARIEHAEVGAGRLKRRKVAELTVTNGAYLLRRNSTRPERDRATYYTFLLRRVLAEFLKDTLTGRFTYPQLRGTVRGAMRVPQIFSQPPSSLGLWYEDMQRAILTR